MSETSWTPPYIYAGLYDEERARELQAPRLNWPCGELTLVGGAGGAQSSDSLMNAYKASCAQVGIIPFTTTQIFFQGLAAGAMGIIPRRRW
jgi:hypothetical protein